MSSFQDALNKMQNTKTEYIIAGHYNIDILKHKTHEGTDKFINAVVSHSLSALIIRPTRFCIDKSSLIDNIFISKPTDNAIWGTLITDIFYIIN